MSIKIAYITNVRIPNHDAVSEQVVNTLSALASHNPNITLVIPHFPKVFPTLREIENFYHVNIGFKTQPLKYVFLISDAVKKKLHVVFAPLYCWLQEYDLLYTRHPAILAVCLLLRMKTVFETYRIDINYLPKYRLWKTFCYSNTNLAGFIVHSELAKKALVENGVKEKNILVAYNGYTIKEVEESKIQGLKKNLSIKPGDIVVAYAGRIGTKAKRTDILLQLAHVFPHIKFLIIGAGKKQIDDAAFDAMIQEMKLTNVIRTGWIDPSNVPDYLHVAEILIIPPSSDPLRSHGKTVLPMKTFMYMSIGKAIVAPNLPDIAEILEHQKNAILVESDNLEHSIDQLARLIADPDLRKRLGMQCLKDIRLYTWESRAQKISAFINQINIET